MNSITRLWWVCGFLACGLLACRSAPPVERESVKPGINDSFLGEDFDLQKFIDRFEGESREIAREHKALAAALRVEPGMQVADVGAGTGLFLQEFSRAVGPEGRLYVVDIAPDFIEYLEGRIEAEGLQNVETVLCTERSAELAPNSVDRIFVCDTYHHFEYPLSTLWSLRRALRPGGELILVDFERIEGVSRDWLLDHVRAGKDVFRSEVEQSGFEFVEEVEIPGLEENYVLRFR
jgi:ubiquinone/menaquinone biosynthesis C-methylase UbiE